jgi:hypothetical protein
MHAGGISFHIPVTPSYCNLYFATLCPETYAHAISNEA